MFPIGSLNWRKNHLSISILWLWIWSWYLPCLAIWFPIGSPLVHPRHLATPPRSRFCHGQTWEMSQDPRVGGFALKKKTWRCHTNKTAHAVTHTHITLHYITLHYITLHYITLHYIFPPCCMTHSVHYITLRYPTLHCTTLHYTTLHYITLHTHIHNHIYIYIWYGYRTHNNSPASKKAFGGLTFTNHHF